MDNDTYSCYGASRIKFEYLWREELIHIPPLDKMSPEEYNKLKEWAWKVFIRVHNVEV